MEPQKRQHCYSKAGKVYRSVICDHVHRTKDKGLRLVDHNVTVNGNSDWEANDVENQDDVNDGFKDFLEDFEISVQDY